jgi:hypothetical protein
MVFAISLGEVEWIKNQNGELLPITPEPKIFIGDTNINPDVVDSEQKIYYGSVKFDGAYSREEIEASETIFKEAWIEELARRNLSYGFNLNRDGYTGGI